MPQFKVGKQFHVHGHATITLGKLTYKLPHLVSLCLSALVLSAKSMDLAFIPKSEMLKNGNGCVNMVFECYASACKGRDLNPYLLFFRKVHA